MQDAFGHVTNSIRTILRILCGELGPDGQSLDQDDVSDLAQPTVLKVTNMRFPPVLPSSTDHITKMCISFLAFVPILESSSAEATRDKDLTDLVLACATSSHPENFLQVCPALLDHVRCGAITLNPRTLEAYLAGVGHISPMYAYAKNDILQGLVIRVLDSTCHIWLDPSDLLEGIRDKVSQLCQWLCTTTSQRLLGSWRVRDSAACFLDRYLDCDPTQVSWTKLNGRELTRPADLLSMMIADEDIRVRFRAATLAPRLLALVRLGARRPEVQYDSIRLKLSTNLKHSAVRRGPYWHMLETCLHSKDYSPHIQAILVQVAQRLGLGSPSVLFQLYASQIAFSVREHNPLSIPYDVLGYQNLSDYAEAAFRPFTPTNLIARPKDLGTSLFKSHCDALSKRHQNGIRECFGDIIGIRVAGCFAEDEDPDGVEDILRETVQTGTDVMDVEEFRDLLKQTADSIITSILHTLGDQDFTQAGPLHHGLQVLAGSKAAEEFAVLNRYRDDRYFATHEPHFPINPASSVLRSIIWMCSKFSESRHPAVTFHVMQALLMEIHKSPLVNEQVRLSNALTLWVAFRNEHFKEFTLLHTLAQGATSLMVQSDLARVSQSILEWCFECYRNELQDDPCLPDILIRLCFQADDYAKDTGKGGFAKLGETLTDWIDDNTHWDAFGDNWDPRISSNKFRLVRRLRELASDDDTDRERFGRADFWRLKECIPPPSQIQEEDIHAFAGLLVSHRGQVDGIGMDHPNPFSVRTKHLSSKRGPNEEGSPQNAILFSLVTMLDSGDPFEVQSAYTTLRLVASCSPMTIHPSSWPIQISQTLGHFQLCLPLPARFYSQLTPMLTSNHDFAEQLLPVLVHTILQDNADKSSKELLSQYFLTTIKAADVAIRCLSCVIDVVLHLRQFEPQATGVGKKRTNALGHNEWLSLDFALLAQSCIACGAYTTALLFLELAAEYNHSLFRSAQNKYFSRFTAT
ncbi:Serine/threonine-protein kinase [Salix suchowensis]|nr:Serine/threonine-protein kinase [Salix suchowensis]